MTGVIRNTALLAKGPGDVGPVEQKAGNDKVVVERLQQKCCNSKDCR